MLRNIGIGLSVGVVVGLVGTIAGLSAWTTMLAAGLLTLGLIFALDLDL